MHIKSNYASKAKNSIKPPLTKHNSDFIEFTIYLIKSESRNYISEIIHTCKAASAKRFDNWWKKSIVTNIGYTTKNCKSSICLINIFKTFIYTYKIYFVTSNIIKMQKYITNISNCYKNTFSKLNSVCFIVLERQLLQKYKDYLV